MPLSSRTGGRRRRGMIGAVRQITQAPTAGIPPSSFVEPRDVPGRSSGDDGWKDDDAGEPSSTGSAEPPPLQLRLVPERSTLSSGDILLVKVVLTGGRKVTSVPFHVRFDSGVLEYLGARIGMAPPAGTLQPMLLASVNPRRPGNLAVGFSLAGSSGAYNGSGTLVLLEFRALAPGPADLLFENTSVRGATGEPLATELQGCSVRVR